MTIAKKYGETINQGRWRIRRRRGRIWRRRETRSWKGNGNDKSNNEKHTIKEGEAGGSKKKQEKESRRK